MYRVSSKSIDFSISSLIQSFQSRQNAENEQKMTWLVSSTWSVRVIFKSITRKLFTKIRATVKSDSARPKLPTEMMIFTLIGESWKKSKTGGHSKGLLENFLQDFQIFRLWKKIDKALCINHFQSGTSRIRNPRTNFLENLLSRAPVRGHLPLRGSRTFANKGEPEIVNI